MGLLVTALIKEIYFIKSSRNETGRTHLSAVVHDRVRSTLLGPKMIKP